MNIHSDPVITRRVIPLVLLAAGLLAAVFAVLILAHTPVQKTIESLLVGMWEKQPAPPHSLPPRWTGQVFLLGWESLFLAVLGMGLGAALLLRFDRTGAFFSRPANLIMMTGILALVLLLPVVIWGHSDVIGGSRIWWLGDDPMISMRYARNLASGHGPVYNPGEPVEGYTNFLWMAVMAMVHLLPVSITHTSLVVMIINVILALALIPFLVRLTRLLGGGLWGAGLTLAAYVLNRDILFCTTTGFETPLLTLLFVWGVCRMVDESQQSRPRPATYVILAVMSLVRADGIVLTGLSMAASFVLQKTQRKRVILYSLAALIMPLAHVIFRLQYYGYPLPNTAYLKVMGWAQRFRYGLDYVRGFAVSYGLFLVAALAGATGKGRLSAKILFLLTGIFSLYVFYVGGDAFHHFRFFIPLIPLLMALAFSGIRQMIRHPAVLWISGLLLLVLSPVVFPGYSLFFALPRTADRNNVALGLIVQRNTGPDTRVADDWAGNIFYFCNRYAVDFLGKSETHVAHMDVVSPEARPGHNKYDYTYSIGTLRPDVVISHFKLPVTETEMREQSAGPWAFIGALYFDPVFRKHCYPNPVSLDTWRTVFICDWSPLVASRDRWQALHQPE